MTSRSNTVTGVLTTYQFDHRNRLTNVVDRASSGVVTQTVAFVYDAMNRRLSKMVNGEVTCFLYNHDDSWADLDGSSDIVARYLLGARIDELLARQRGNDGRGWYLTDHLGTVRDIANAAGAVVAHVDYSSFGQVIDMSNGAEVDRFLFTGRELDIETGLSFYRARYYSTQLGRFITNDPVGFATGDRNLYRYVANSPALFVDPFGETLIERVYVSVLNLTIHVTFVAYTYRNVLFVTIVIVVLLTCPSEIERSGTENFFECAKAAITSVFGFALLTRGDAGKTIDRLIDWFEQLYSARPR